MQDLNTSIVNTGLMYGTDTSTHRSVSPLPACLYYIIQQPYALKWLQFSSQVCQEVCP